MGRNSRRGGESPDEVLRGKIRELAKEVRRKDQEIRHLRKEIDRLQGKVKLKEPSPQKIQDNLCPDCGKGELRMIELPRGNMTPLIFWSCNTCDYKVKKR